MSQHPIITSVLHGRASAFIEIWFKATLLLRVPDLRSVLPPSCFEQSFQQAYNPVQTFKCQHVDASRKRAMQLLQTPGSNTLKRLGSRRSEDFCPTHRSMVCRFLYDLHIVDFVPPIGADEMVCNKGCTNDRRDDGPCRNASTNLCARIVFSGFAKGLSTLS